jgi:hypothetical protein
MEWNCHAGYVVIQAPCSIETPQLIFAPPCPDESVIAALPYPLPIPALSLAEALNVKLENVTRSVKFANSEKTITQPSEKKVNNLDTICLVVSNLLCVSFPG